MERIAPDRTLHLREPLAYLAGVLLGDAYLSKRLGLRVRDKDFAEAFAAATRRAFSIPSAARPDRGYWRVIHGNMTGRFDFLRGIEPRTAAQRRAWVLGLFDSEGNVSFVKLRRGRSSYSRRISMYSTNIITLIRAGSYSRLLGIRMALCARKWHPSHYGTKVVYELATSDRRSLERFASLIGCSIYRKRRAMVAMLASYTEDISGARRAAQLLGARAKHKKTMTITLPRVVDGVRALIIAGVKPTQRACRSIAGFNSIQRHVPQASLVSMARRTSCAP